MQRSSLALADKFANENLKWHEELVLFVNLEIGERVLVILFLTSSTAVSNFLLRKEHIGWTRISWNRLL
ncbi:hypothetical protein CMV_022807 [Castanea mollissima]|uniref:Uncharacterized protein n=1 Tax=Castanea mollissima TaxID=60419 RepID=A0A8J4QLJ2_9ROSI|nr:hypothetical protein CMV_022807 [Castanea mollissima]